jgi:hypothetical protein
MSPAPAPTLQIPPPDPDKAPLCVNIFTALRLGNTALLALFPYNDSGDIQVTGTVFIGGPGRETGVFFHDNTRDELSVIFGAQGSHYMACGATMSGARVHSVGNFIDEVDDPASFLVLNVIQRQAEGAEAQREVMSWLCSQCQTPLLEVKYAGKTPQGEAIRARPLGYAPPVEAVVQAARALEPFNADPALRVCKHCGFENPPFPVAVWGWDTFTRNYGATERARAQLLATPLPEPA